MELIPSEKDRIVVMKDPLTGKRTSYCNGNDGHVDGLPSYADLPLFKRQLRIVMRNCGIVDPASLEEYAARGGYHSLWKALWTLKPEDIVREVTASSGCSLSSGWRTRFS